MRFLRGHAPSPPGGGFGGPGLRLLDGPSNIKCPGKAGVGGDKNLGCGLRPSCLWPGTLSIDNRTHTHTPTHARTRTHAHARTHTHARTRTHTHAPHARTRTHAPARTHPHARTRTHAPARTHPHARTRTHAPARAHPHPRARARAHAHAHAHTHNQALSSSSLLPHEALLPCCLSRFLQAGPPLFLSCFWGGGIQRQVEITHLLKVSTPSA